MIKTLKEIKSILDKLGVEFFLEYGTCLGAYRDNDFLPDDRDIDIGIFGIEHLDKIREAFKSNGYEVKDPTMYLSLIKDIPVDIHFYIEQPHCYQTFVKIQKPYFFFPKKFNKFQEIEFKGMTFNILTPVEDYLEWVYGEWKDKNSRKSSAYNWKNKKI